MKAGSSNIRNLVPPFTFHHLKMKLRRESISKLPAQNSVTGKYLFNDFFGRNLMTIAHKIIALTILKKFAIRVPPPFFPYHVTFGFVYSV